MNEFDAESMIELKRAFRIFDSNNDGVISFEELKQAFDNLHKKLTNEELRIVMSEADSNGDGMISFNDFVRIFNESF